MVNLVSVVGAAMLLFANDQSRPLVTLTVPAQAGHEDFTIDIALDGADTPSSREEWDRLTWTAIKTRGGNSETISSTTCPQLKAVAEAFRSLPPITPTPLANIVRGEPLPLNTLALGGWGAWIEFKTFSGANVRVSGTDAYGSWASTVINELSSCWNTKSQN